MDSTHWTLSSSSDSESDDDREVTKFRKSSLFYQQYHRGEYGDEFSDEDIDVNNHRPNVQANIANSSILANGDANANGNTTFANISCVGGLDESRIISPNIFSNTVDDFVLYRDGGKFRLIRVVSSKEILPLRTSPESKKQKLMPNKDVKTEQHDEKPHKPKEIPLEIVDAIDFPRDPRKPKREEGFHDKEEEFNFVLPRFWRETVLKTEMDKNKERNSKLDGSYRRSNSYIRERTLQRTQRLATVAPRTDPRLMDRSLFAERPRKIVTPPKKHNMSQPNINRSIFECDAETENISSSEFSSESFESIPSVDDAHFNGNNGTNGLDSDSEPENTLSFMDFLQKRNKSTDSQTNKRMKPTDKKKETKPSRVTRSSLFGKPPKIDKESILSALTDDTTSSEDQENKCTNKNSAKVATEKPLTKKKKTKVAPIRSYESKPKNIPHISLSSDIQSNKETSNDVKPTVETMMDNTLTNDTATSSQTETNLNKSTSSNSSIEQRLAEMISPVKRVKINTNEQNETSLADILSENIGENIHPSENEVESMQVEECVANDSGIQTGTDNSPVGSSADITEMASNEQFEPLLPAVDENNGNTETTTSKKDVKEGEGNSTIEDIVSENEPKTFEGQQDEEEKLQKETPIEEEKDQNQVTNLAIDENACDSDILSAEIPNGMEIGANIDINEHENDNTSDTLDPKDLDVLGREIELNLCIDEAQKDVKKKGKRTKIIIKDFIDHENVSMLLKQKIDDIEMSDEDYEDDKPCGMDELILPNSNTDRNSIDEMKSNCKLCPYEAVKGWKQLTKHYVRKHPDQEISTSRLSNVFNPQEINETSFSPLITKHLSETMIQSLCYICNNGYNMSSSKWLLHFIAHTGEFEFQCNSCDKEIMQDLHKQCNSRGNKRINGPHDFIDNILYGYVCTLCNYVQLNKDKVITHLDKQHQQLIKSEHVIEIILLKSTQPITDFLIDDKNDKDLMKAKELINNRYENHSPVSISDDDDDDKKDIKNIKPMKIRTANLNESNVDTVDLTLSDDDI